MKNNSKKSLIDLKTIRKRKVEISKLLYLLKKISNPYKSDKPALENSSNFINEKFNEKDAIIPVNFKAKKRRNLKIEALSNETFDYISGKIKNDNHLLKPGPDCYSRDEIISHIKNAFIYSNLEEINGYKLANEHIFYSCKRCRALFHFVSQKLAGISIPELREKSVAQLVHELF